MSSDKSKMQFNRASADQPAQSLKDDLLGRSSFAAAIARAMLNWSVPESLVVSLTGPWGSGKSSIVNFIVEAIRNEQSENQADVLRFNPWQSAEQLDSGKRLLREIAITLKHNSGSPKDQQISKKWNQWAAALSLSASTFEVFSKLPGILVLAGLLGVSTTRINENSTLKCIFEVFSFATITIGAVMQLSTKITDKAAAFLKARADASERTLDELRLDLRNAMLQHSRQLIVIIDDIDRLPQTEVQSLFRTIRANADFPHLIFLLVFERGVVEKALTDQAHVDGAEYLKKIIQVPFSIPNINPGKVHDVFKSSLHGVAGEDMKSVHFDSRRWVDVFAGGIDYYLPTLRDVYRYITTFNFHLGLFRSGETLEINQIDLIALEVLRVFEPRIHEALPRFKTLLLEGAGRSRLGARDKEEMAKSDLDKLLSLAQKPENRSAAKQILTGVFKPLDWLLSNHVQSSGFDDQWERELRACSGHYFERYFNLSIREDELPQSEVESVLKVVSSRTALVGKLQQFRERNLLDAVLSKLSAHKEAIELQAAIPFVTALFDIGEHLPTEPGAFYMNAQSYATGVIRSYLLRLSTHAERENVFMAATKDTEGVQLPVDLLCLEDSAEDYANGQYVFSEERLPELQRLCVEKISNAARDGRLLHHQGIASLMCCWLVWTDGTAVRAWANSVGSTSVGALALIRGFIQKSFSYNTGSGLSSTSERVNTGLLFKFVRVNTLTESLGPLVANLPAGEEQRMAPLLRQVLTDLHEKAKAEITGD